MKLILEGPDNAGKTSLAMRLVADLGSDVVSYHHPGGKPIHMDAELVDIGEQWCLLQIGGNHILDRITCISQSVFNPDTGVDGQRMYEIRQIVDLKPIIIYCRPSTDRLLRVQDLTWRDGESEEHKQKIIQNQHTFVERYDELFQKIPHISYDYDDEAHRELIFTKLCNAFKGSAEDERWFIQLMDFRSTR